MKTYQEWLLENPEVIVFPEQIGEAEQNKIFLWFKYREVSDNNRFGDYFQRTIDECAEQYHQLLRIEPGVTKYDWLVSRYTEAQRKKKDSDSTESKHSTNDVKIGSVSTAYGKTVTNTKTGDDTTSLLHGEKISSSMVETLSSDNKETSGTKRSNVRDISTKTGSQTKTQIDTRHYHDDQTTQHEGDTVTKTDGYYINDKKQLEKANPMSTSYPSIGVVDPVDDPTAAGGGSNASGAPLDWTAPTGQEQTYGRDIDHSTQRVTDPDIKVERESYVAAGGMLQDTTSYNGLNDTNTQSSNNYVDMKEKHSYTKGEGSNVRHTGTDETTVTYDSSVESSSRGVDKINSTDKAVGTDSGTITRDGQSLDRYQQSGRDEAPADILKRAVTFISNTNAWRWLRDELEVCFLGIYE